MSCGSPVPSRLPAMWLSASSRSSATPAGGSSTTVTVTGSSGVEGRWRGVQDGADAIPETLLTPALIPAVGGVPGAVAWRQFAPRDAVVQDPKQAPEQTPVVQGRAATGRLLRGQERRDLLPEGVAERRGPREPSGQRRGSRSAKGLARRAPGDMPLAGAGLVVPPPLRPLEPRAPPGLLRLGQQEQQAPHLGDG